MLQINILQPLGQFGRKILLNKNLRILTLSKIEFQNIKFFNMSAEILVLAEVLVE
jgi:hypothetical protein